MKIPYPYLRFYEVDCDKVSWLCKLENSWIGAIILILIAIGLFYLIIRYIPIPCFDDIK